MNRFSNYARIIGFFAFVLILGIWTTAAQAQVNLQVFSVQDEAAARKEVDRLFNQGVPAFTQAEEVQGRGLWNRVYIGPFETENEARAAANNLKTSGIINDFVVKTQTASAAPSEADAPLALDPDVPVVGGGAEQSQQSLPPLPVASTPTYGETVTPEQARELGLTGVTAPGSAPLTTYGEADAVPAPPAATPSGVQTGDTLPDLRDGDTLPGIVGGGAAGTASQGSGRLPTYGEMNSGASSAASLGSEVAVIPPPAPVAPAAPPAEATAGAPAIIPAPAPVAVEPDPTAAQTTSTRPAPRPDGPTTVADMKIAGFTMLVDLSSSMRNMAGCQGRIKEEAVASLLRKMNHRIPGQPYNATLRVFGYRSTLTRANFTTTYFGPQTYNRDLMEDSIARLVAADSVSPFADAISAADNELMVMGNPKAVLMFADFEESMGSGNPVQNVKNARRRYGNDLAVYTFYVTRTVKGANLAKELASAGGGKAYDICRLLDDADAFENMMMEIFGPADLPPCSDSDGDGVCDEDDLCPNTPAGAPVDERGCWIAAYSQFFDFDKAVVKNAFLPRIQHAATILSNNPNLPRVTIAGHTDNIGTDAYNMDLGRRRAQAVFDLMVKYGVQPDRMIVESYGKTRPIAPNDNEEGRSKNRRVEFHIGDMPATSSH